MGGGKERGKLRHGCRGPGRSWLLKYVSVRYSFRDVKYAQTELRPINELQFSVLDRVAAFNASLFHSVRSSFLYTLYLFACRLTNNGVNLISTCSHFAPPSTGLIAPPIFFSLFQNHDQPEIGTRGRPYSSRQKFHEHLLDFMFSSASTDSC